MTILLLRLRLLLRAHEPAAVHEAVASLSDWWLDFKMRTADRYATSRQRERARMQGEVWALTGEYITGWPGRYLAEHVDGEAARDLL